MKDFFKRFFAVDNSVNEHTTVGAFWTLVTLVLVIIKVIPWFAVETELVYMTLGASLLAFGISGFKKV